MPVTITALTPEDLTRQGIWIINLAKALLVKNVLNKAEIIAQLNHSKRAITNPDVIAEIDSVIQEVTNL